MKSVKYLLIVLFLLCVIPAFALKGVLATEEDMTALKKDILAGNIQAGKTRLSEIQEKYGEAASIKETDKMIIYDYNGNLKIEFEKKCYMRKWEYDYSQPQQYRNTTEIKQLRKDLAAERVAGEYVEFNEKIVKDYKKPTAAFEKFGDGELSIYYYGELKLTFENVYAVKKWEGKELDKLETGVLTSSSAVLSTAEKK